MEQSCNSCPAFHHVGKLLGQIFWQGSEFNFNGAGFNKYVCVCLQDACEVPLSQGHGSSYLLGFHRLGKSKSGKDRAHRFIHPDDRNSPLTAWPELSLKPHLTGK